MQEKYDYITLENGEDYLIIAEENIINDRYIYLINEHDYNDIVIRKYQNINGENMIVGLNDKEEFDTALIYFTNKYGKEVNAC